MTSSPQLIASFKHYEHQGINIKLTTTVGETIVLEIVREDTQNTLLKVELPKNTKLLDRR